MAMGTELGRPDMVLGHLAANMSRIYTVLKLGEELPSIQVSKKIFEA